MYIGEPSERAYPTKKNLSKFTCRHTLNTYTLYEIGLKKYEKFLSIDYITTEIQLNISPIFL